MAIKRYVADKDTTITNAYRENLSTRGSDANMGASDVLEIFSIYSQASTSSQEESRILINFPISTISSDRSKGKIPASGSVNFYLRLFNVEHSETLPVDYRVQVAALTKSWSEGYGLDMEGYTDYGTGSSAETGFGATWLSASGPHVANWANAHGGWAAADGGGDITTASYYQFSKKISEKGNDDLDIKVTPLVEDWINERKGLSGSNGFLIRLHPDEPTGSKSFYTKRFYARHSEFFFKRPVLEARWGSAKKDDSARFYISSSLVQGPDNLNKIYLYNVVRGEYKNIPGLHSVSGKARLKLSLFTSGNLNSTSSAGGDPITLPIGGGVSSNNAVEVTATYVEKGVYSASFAYTGSEYIKYIYPVWHTGSSTNPHNNTQFVTGSAIRIRKFNSSDYNPSPDYVTKIINLKSIYSNEGSTRFRVFVREKGWNPTIYSVATTEIEPTIIDDAYFRVIRLTDNYEVIGYNTGSDSGTMMSYDAKGNYFDLDMAMFEPDFGYGFKFSYRTNGELIEQKELHKFRVE